MSEYQYEQYRFKWNRPDECELFELRGDAYILVGTFRDKTEKGVLNQYLANRNPENWLDYED